MPETPVLKVENLKQYFKLGRFLETKRSIRAVDDVSFSLQGGETLGLVGETGCGKTTLGRAIIRLYRPNAGKIFLQGKDIAQISDKKLKPLRQKIQMIFQNPAGSLDSRHTIRTILEEPFLIQKTFLKSRDRLQRVEELLRDVGLSTDFLDRYPHEFSGGQRQRICIARALALDPQLLICDEPVSALDVSVRAQIINLLLKLQQEKGLSLLFISHDLSVVRHISDRIAVMYLGKIVEMAPSQEMYRTPRHPYTHALIASIPLPDPAERKKMTVLSGDVPSPVDPPLGCSFHTRCPQVMPICRQKSPPLIEIGKNHFCSCHLVKGKESAGI